MRKMMHWCWVVLLLSLTVTTAAAQPIPETDTAVSPAVQALLFYSPSCPHCHYVIAELLAPMQETYGERLQILGLNTQETWGAQLYNDAIAYYKIPESRLGVPTLIVADTILVGSQEIEAQFPPLVDAGFAGDGIAWPELPALHLLFPDLPNVNDPIPAAAPEVDEGAAAATAVPKPAEPAALGVSGDEAEATAAVAPPPDPVGMGIAWGVLGLMAVSVLLTGRLLQKPPQVPTRLLAVLIPALSLLGLSIALYLSYVEITHVAAVCGPVGACNVVQTSPYASIGVVPVAVLGALNYLALLLLWGWQQRRPSTHRLVRPLLLGMGVLGTLFSIYLTVLEIFVIHAVCLWCLSSAVTTALLMLLFALVLRTTAVPDAEGVAKGAWS